MGISKSTVVLSLTRRLFINFDMNSLDSKRAIWKGTKNTDNNEKL